jgi:hypothetical protein
MIMNHAHVLEQLQSLFQGDIWPPIGICVMLGGFMHQG